MSSLSHEQVRAFIQRGYLPEEDRPALQQHLSSCDACRAYAATHVLLWRDLPLRAPASRQAPTAAQREAILAQADGKRVLPPLWRPLSALGSVAAMVFLTLAFWLVLRAASPVADRPVLPAPLATLLAPVWPEPTPEMTPDPRGRYVIDTVPAPSLAGNIIGEPLEQQVVVYLPPSYDDGRDQRYPVVYALSYTLNSGADPFSDVGPQIRSAMNLALQSGLGQEMIVVAPDSINALNVPNYFATSSLTGDWESFIARDLVAYMDEHYRTLPQADSRGLLGQDHTALSALSIAMRHRDVFSAVYLSRPWVISPGGLEQSSFAMPTTRSTMLSLMDEVATLPPAAVADWLREYFDATNRFSVMGWIVGYGIAYAPTTGHVAPYFEYPYTDVDGPPDAARWQKWESGQGAIPEKLQPHLGALRTLDIAITQPEGPTTPALLVPDGPAYLSQQLTNADIPHSFQVLNKPAVEELGQNTFPFFSEALGFE